MDRDLGRLQATLDAINRRLGDMETRLALLERKVRDLEHKATNAFDRPGGGPGRSD